MSLRRRKSPTGRQTTGNLEKITGNLEKIADDLHRAYRIPHWDTNDYLGVVHDAWIIAQYHPVVANPSGLIFVIARRMITQQLKTERRTLPIDADMVSLRIGVRLYLHWYTDDGEDFG